MTSRAPGQGSSAEGPRKVVSSGHFRVDARRAVEKLREHLLVDLHLYALELTRCASAGGASAIDVRYDSDDLFIGFDGEPFEPEILSRLLDHLLSEAATPEARRCRLLALAVNAALGLGSQHVDLYTTAGGAVTRVRWTPAMLDPKNEGRSTPEPAAARRPRGMPARGSCVHVRRRAGWGVLRQAVVGGVPREITLLADSTHDLPIPITLDGAPLETTPQPRALIRVHLEIPGAARAFLEIRAVTAPQKRKSAGEMRRGEQSEAAEPEHAGAPTWLDAPAVIEFLEHGVALVRHAWAPGGGFPAGTVAVHLPVRVVVDAGSLPTNASRSALREDASLVRLAVERSQAAFRRALEALAARVSGAALGSEPGPQDVEVSCDDPALLEDALGAVICVVAGAARGGATIPPEARALLALPVLRDAVGRPISPESLGPASKEAPLYVWSRRARVPEELAPWMGGVVWARGRIVEKLFADGHVIDAREIVERAREAHERRRRHLEHPRMDPRVADGHDYLSRDVFHVEEGPLAGLRGEAAIRSPRPADAQAAAPRESTVRVFIEGRLLETYPLPRDLCPLPVDLAVAWDGAIRPDFSFRSVSHDHALDSAIGHAIHIAVAAAGRIAESLPSVSRAAAALLIPLLQLAVATHASLAASAAAAASSRGGSAGQGSLSPGQPLGAAPGPLSNHRGLFRAPLWKTLHGDELVSLEQLDTYAAATGAICTVRDADGSGNIAREPPDGRPVIAVGGDELRWLAWALGRPVTVVPYDRALFGEQQGWSPEEHRARAVRAALAKMSTAPVGVPDVEMAINRPGASGLITPSRKSQIARLHTGVLLEVSDRAPRYGRVEIALDEDTIVPTPEWNAVLWPKAIAGFDAIERDLCEAIVGSLEGNVDARQRLQGSVPVDPTQIGAMLRDYLIESAVAIRRRRPSAPPRAGQSRQDPDQSLLDRIEALAIMTMLDASGAPAPASLAAIAEQHPRARRVPVLRHPPDFVAPGWRPVIIADAQAFGRWCGNGTYSVEDELPERRRQAEEARARAAFLASPEVDPRCVDDLADPGARVVHEESSTPAGVVSFAVALPALGGFFLGVGDPGGESSPVSASFVNPAGAPFRDADEGSDAIVDVLFEGRRVERRTIRAGVPVVARVSLADPEHIAGYRGLSSKGEGQVAGLVRQGAVALALALVEQNSAGASLFEDVRALRLIAALLEDKLLAAATGPLRADLCSGGVLWPTVQGEEHTFLRLKASIGQIDIGRERYSSWRSPARARTELDQPILYVPSSGLGRTIEVILRALSFAPRDVTWALAKLQSGRAAAMPVAPPPRLSGAPAHPALRVSLASVGVISCDGELEVVAGPRSDIAVTGIEGAARILDVSLPFPIRAVVRAEIAEATEQSARSTLLDVARGARVHLRGLAPRLDELPVFVRDHLRALICDTIGGKTAFAAKDEKAQVFIDISGRYRALADLREANDPAARSFTTDPPPYPASAAGSPVLRLDKKEAAQLRGMIELTDVTAKLRDELAGERRAGAAPVVAVALGDEHRRACLQIGAVRDGRLEGEVGILAPEHAAARGVEVFTTRRPLCLLDDGRGWPLRAAVDDPEARPNRRFDGFESAKRSGPIRARVRAAADRALQAWIRPPPDALAVRWLLTEPCDAGPLQVIGALWLPAAWPAHPSVQVRAAGQSAMVTFRLSHSPSSFESSAPIGGEIFVVEDGARQSLSEQGWSALTAMVARQARSLIEEARSLGIDAIEAYAWNLALVDRQSSMQITTADGKSVSSEEIVAELGRRGGLWLTSRRGVAEGDFPGEAPAFVLVDGGPLVEVLRARLPKGALRELGGPSPPCPPLPEGRGGWEASVPVPVPASASAPVPAPAPASAPVSDPPATSWLSGLIRKTASLVRSYDRDAPGHDPLRLALQGALDGLPAVGPEIAAIAYAESGRPLRYAHRTRRLVLRRDHPAVAKLVAKAHDDPRARSVLLAAALTEVNRALESVTDAEEIRILRELLSPTADGGAD